MPLHVDPLSTVTIAARGVTSWSLCVLDKWRIEVLLKGREFIAGVAMTIFR